MSTHATTRDRLADRLSGPIGALGLDLEAVDLSSAGKRRVLRVAIDRDGGVTMDDIAEAFALAHRIGIVDSGELLVYDTPRHVAASADPRVRAFLDAVPRPSF